MAAAGTAMIGVLMVVICTDVVARNLLGSSLPLVSELSALMLVMIVYLQLATTVRHDRLARADLFLSAYRTRHPRAGAMVAALFDLIGAAALGVMAWATIGIVGRDISSGEFIGITGVLTVPTWPFRAVIALGLVVAAVQFAVRLATELCLATSGPKEGAS
ncbi:MAG: TRAP transporter small permease, partial [Paracoccaceae bacterium]|nr:TRAP transporter small permease [Paracoccaceae bacterium]